MNKIEMSAYLTEYRRTNGGPFVFLFEERPGDVPNWVKEAAAAGIIRNSYIEGIGDTIRVYEPTMMGRAVAFVLSIGRAA